MHDKNLFLRSFLFMVLIGTGAFIINKLGAFSYVASVDITKLSFLIMFIFCIATLFCGYIAWKYNDGNASHQERASLSHKTEHIWFAADICEYFGILGTIFGFIFLFSKVHLQEMNAEALEPLFRTIWNGTGTALITTATGIIAMILLKIQARLLEGALQSRSNR